jgi:hypothetical protein
MTLCDLKIFHLLSKLLDSNHVSLNFMLDNSHSGVTNLIGQEEFVELSKVRIRLEDVKQIQCEFERLLIIISERAGYGSKQSFMLQHVLHVLVTKAEVEQTHSALNLLLNCLLVKAFDVLIQILYTYLGEVNLWPLGFL